MSPRSWTGKDWRLSDVRGPGFLATWMHSEVLNSQNLKDLFWIPGFVDADERH